MWMKHYSLNEDEQKLLDMTAEEFDAYMMQNYTEMFRKRHPAPDQKYIEPMNFGFEIGKGWRHLLNQLCKEVQVLQETFNFILVFDQIKEKFASARFYCHVEFPENTEVSEKQNVAANIAELLVNHYEEYTDYVCEELGTNISPNKKISIGGWHYAMGLEGFKQSIMNSHYSDEEKTELIKDAEKASQKKETLASIKEKLHYLKQTDLDEVLALTEAKIEILKKEQEERMKKYK